MEITGVEWTDLADDFGYYTVSVSGIEEERPVPFPSAPINNCFKAWKASDELEKFIGDVVQDLMYYGDKSEGKWTYPVPNIGRKCWGNYFDRIRHKSMQFSHLPHVDGPGWVGNLWMTDHPEGERGTQFYTYKSQWKEDKFSFMKDVLKPSSTSKEMIRRLQDNIEYYWEQWDIGSIEGYGFKYLGTAPAKKDTITVYNSMIPHTAYCGNIDISYSQLVKVATAPTHIE